MFKIIPYSDRILVEKLNDKGAGKKIILPDKAMDRQVQFTSIGEVKAIGGAVDPDSLKVGDLIIFVPNCVRNVPHHEVISNKFENHIMMNAEDIVAILEEVDDD